MFLQRKTTKGPDNSHSDDIRKEHVKKMSEKVFEKGDPDFVDERKHKEENEKEKEKSFLESLFGGD